jgi:hypothetical protein
MSTIPPISTKQTTFHLKQLNTKKTMTYGIGNPGPSFEQAQTCVRVKPVNGIPNFPVYKQTIKTCIDSLPLKKDHNYYHKGQHKHGLYNSRVKYKDLFTYRKVCFSSASRCIQETKIVKYE